MSENAVLSSITTVASLLGRLERGEALRGEARFGSTREHGAHAVYRAFLGLRKRAKGRLTPDILKQWIRQVMDAEGIGYARVLRQDLFGFCKSLTEAEKNDRESPHPEFPGP